MSSQNVGKKTILVVISAMQTLYLCHTTGFCLVFKASRRQPVSYKCVGQSEGSGRILDAFYLGEENSLLGQPFVHIPISIFFNRAFQSSKYKRHAKPLHI